MTRRLSDPASRSATIKGITAGRPRERHAVVTIERSYLTSFAEHIANWKGDGGAVISVFGSYRFPVRTLFALHRSVSLLDKLVGTRTSASEFVASRVRRQVTTRANYNFSFYWVCALSALTVGDFAFNSLTSSNFDLLNELLFKSTVPLVACVSIVLLVQYFKLHTSYIIMYALFFAISITSLLGLTQTLTGSHAESSNTFLYGLSFYTASLAYLAFRQRLSSTTPLIVSNPLLVFTGPIATFFGDIRYRAFGNRVRYYFPFVVLGLFLHQAIATPLTQTFGLITETDVISSLTFATIFELFVYANFCGLSLMVYGVAGLIGFRIPLNFRQPFSSTNVIEFWKGWHTSLSTVLKCLFYTPTRKRFGTSFALLSVYIASAMWHGVTLNFLIWGLFHATMFIITLQLLKRGQRALPLFILIVAIILGRLFFADSDTSRLLEKLHFAFVDFSAMSRLMSAPDTTKLSLALIAVFVLFEFIFQKTKYFAKRNYKFYRLPIVMFVLLTITLCTMTSGIGVDYAVYGQR